MRLKRLNAILLLAFLIFGACAKKTDTIVTDSSGVTTSGSNYNGSSATEGAAATGNGAGMAPTNIPPDTNALRASRSNGVDSGMGRADTMRSK
jgi:hypothetical protein